GCPHRRASLAYGVVEADGLRCPYHGWLYGVDGSCLDQPAEREETNFRSRVRAAAGVAQELGGLVWAYIGPLPAPELPRFDVFVMDGVRDIGWTELPCNFVRSWRTPSTRTTPSGCTAGSSSSWPGTRASMRRRRSARSTSRWASTRSSGASSSA